MRTFFKRVAIGLAAFIFLIILGGGLFYYSSQTRLTRVYAVPENNLRLHTPLTGFDGQLGEHIFKFRGCQGCHGDKLEGKVYLSDPALGEVIATNLTSGEGGVGSLYQDVDWVRTIRHGLRPTGKPLLFMPSTEFYFLSDEDLGAVISYIKKAPAVDHVLAASSLSLTGRAAMAFVKFITFVPAELIPHSAPRPVAPKPAVTIEYGEYLTYSCKVCHGIGMSGGQIPGFPKGWPSAANLTISQDRYIPYWEKQGFIQIIRTGITRHGREINPQYMPWSSYKYMSDAELEATWVYLASLPPKPFGSR